MYDFPAQAVLFKLHQGESMFYREEQAASFGEGIRCCEFLMCEIYLLYANAANQLLCSNNSVALKAAVGKKQVKQHLQPVSPLKVQNNIFVGPALFAETHVL